jgi:hypothetical protein
VRARLCILLSALTLAACAGTADPRRAENWRQGDGAPVDPVVFDTVLRVCEGMVPRTAAAPSSLPLAIAPPFRPGGEGLASASPLTSGVAGGSLAPSLAAPGAGGSELAPPPAGSGAYYPDMASCIGSVGWRPAG